MNSQRQLIQNRFHNWLQTLYSTYHYKLNKRLMYLNYFLDQTRFVYKQISYRTLAKHPMFFVVTLFQFLSTVFSVSRETKQWPHFCDQIFEQKKEGCTWTCLRTTIICMVTGCTCSRWTISVSWSRTSITTRYRRCTRHITTWWKDWLFLLFSMTKHFVCSKSYGLLAEHSMSHLLQFLWLTLIYIHNVFCFSGSHVKWPFFQLTTDVNCTRHITTWLVEIWWNTPCHIDQNVISLW